MYARETGSLRMIINRVYDTATVLIADEGTVRYLIYMQLLLDIAGSQDIVSVPVPNKHCSCVVLGTFSYHGARVLP